MTKLLFLAAVLLVAMGGFAQTTINNFVGFNNTFSTFGYPDTATYGEVFAVPQTSTMLNSFSFYTGDPINSGQIITGAYIATWNHGKAGTLVYSSPQYNYDNLGNEELTFNTGGLAVNPNGQYVMFLSISQYYGQSAGTTWFSGGDGNGDLRGFVYNNNEGDFNALFNTAWSGPINYGLAVDIEFNEIPEPGSLLMLGTGLLGGIGVLRRKLF